MPLAPMWVVRVLDVLQMKGVPPDHQQLRKLELIVEWQASFLCIFVSHQCLGSYLKRYAWR